MRVQKIIDISKVAIEDFYKKNTLDKSKHWQKYFKGDLKNQKSKIKNQKSKIKNINNLINFRRIDSFSEGLDTHINKIETFNLLEELLNKIDKKFILDNLLEYNIGQSPTNFEYENHYIDYEILLKIYWLNILKKNI